MVQSKILTRDKDSTVYRQAKKGFFCLIKSFYINLGMVMGLFPTVGIPLPYFSYGGSSLLAFSIMTAIFFKLNYADKNSLV
jgi:cell division protein FtsW (lipid II flippase)